MSSVECEEKLKKIHSEIKKEIEKRKKDKKDIYRVKIYDSFIY